ncbi:MAG: hypothetical protein U0174_02445 [Polyangiaceae bacterium]
MIRRLASGCAFLVALFVASTASAQSYTLSRDYFLDPPRRGLYVHGDLFTIGAQASLEHRQELDGDMSMLTSRVSGLISTGFADVGAYSEVRVAFLSLALSAGYRDVWRDYSRIPGNASGELSRNVRRASDTAKSFGAEAWPWGEARMRLMVPLDMFALVASTALRLEDSPDNAFDWFHANVHDGGAFTRTDATLFLRSEKVGAVGPVVRWMNMSRRGTRVNEVAFGLTAAMRLGIKKNADLLGLQILTVPGDQEFGFHLLRLPVMAMLTYRMTFPVYVPPRTP